MYETKARPAATPLALGIAISLVGWPVLGAAVYTGLRRPNDLAPSAPLALLGWVLVIVGAVLVNFGKTVFTGAFPDYWLYALGGLFVLVTLLLPKGIVGTLQALKGLRPRRDRPALELAHEPGPAE